MAYKHGKRWRLAHVTQGLQTGGQEKLLVEFARLADRRRFDLHFIALAERGPIAEQIEQHGWKVTALEQPEGLQPRLVWRLASLFRRLGVNVVHSHDERPMVYTAMALPLAGFPRFIHTQHHGQLGPVSRQRRALDVFSARVPSRFVCVSQDSVGYMIRQGMQAYKLSILPNGIDLERFAYHGPNLQGPVVTVARLQEVKDVGNLVRAAALAVRERPDFRLEIAGDGPCRQEWQALANSLGVADKVQFLGEVRDVPGLLARARLFVLPSLSEGISLTLLEAMASGLPVVATRVGGNPEVVAEGETGLLVPPGNSQTLAEALLTLWRDDAICALYGRSGRQRVEDRFNIRAMVERYEEMYDPEPETLVRNVLLSAGPTQR